MKTLGQVTIHQAGVTKLQHFDFTLAAAAAENFPTGNFIYTTASKFQNLGALSACKHEKCRGYSGVSACFSTLLSLPEKLSFIFFPNLVRDLTPSKTQRAHSRITRCWNRAASAPDAAVSRIIIIKKKRFKVEFKQTVRSAEEDPHR